MTDEAPAPHVGWKEKYYDLKAKVAAAEAKLATSHSNTSERLEAQKVMYEDRIKEKQREIDRLQELMEKQLKDKQLEINRLQTEISEYKLESKTATRDQVQLLNEVRQDDKKERGQLYQTSMQQTAQTVDILKQQQQQSLLQNQMHQQSLTQAYQQTQLMQQQMLTMSQKAMERIMKPAKRMVALPGDVAASCKKRARERLEQDLQDHRKKYKQEPTRDQIQEKQAMYELGNEIEAELSVKDPKEHIPSLQAQLVSLQEDITENGKALGDLLLSTDPKQPKVSELTKHLKDLLLKYSGYSWYLTQRSNQHPVFTDVSVYRELANGNSRSYLDLKMKSAASTVLVTGASTSSTSSISSSSSSSTSSASSLISTITVPVAANVSAVSVTTPITTTVITPTACSSNPQEPIAASTTMIH